MTTYYSGSINIRSRWPYIDTANTNGSSTKDEIGRRRVIEERDEGERWGMREKQKERER